MAAALVAPSPPPPPEQDAARVLRASAHMDRLTAARTLTGEDLVWWRAQPDPATAQNELLACLAALHPSAGVSRLRAGAAALLDDLEQRGGTPEAAQARALVAGGDSAASSRSAVRLAAGATLAHTATTLGVRLCVVDYTAPAPAVHWVRPAEEAPRGLACVAYLEDAHWRLLMHAPSARTLFCTEGELPFALALVHAATATESARE